MQSETPATPLGTRLPSRAQALDAAAALGSIDVLIIGAGINGAATFRDLALQGVRCLIVDREDFGAGASMASSRMAHGGLRYLENGEFRLTAESTRERNRLLRNAPHMIAPLPMAIPFFSRTAGLWTALRRALGQKVTLKERGFVMAEIGLLLYDWFGRIDRSMPLHGVLIGERLRHRFPALNRKVVAVSTYYDAAISMPERIALELIDEGLKAAPGGIAINHCVVTGIVGGAVMLRDTIGNREFSITPKLVLNATGAWIDKVNSHLSNPKPLMGGTKGSHLVLRHPELHAALAGHGMIFDDGGGRVCVVYPMADTVLLGSTDIPVADPDQAGCTAEEQAYLLKAIRIAFPDIAVDERHVAYRFCGVRPLPKSNAATPGAVSRDHSLVVAEADESRPFPVLSLVGGKWTTFRAFAEQVSKTVLARLGRERVVETADRAIGGAAGLPATAEARAALAIDLAARFGLDRVRVEALIGRYGAGAATVAAYIAAGPDQLLPGVADVSEREVRRLIEAEMAMTEDDILLRRTTLAILGRVTPALRQRIAQLVDEFAGNRSAPVEASW